MKLEANETRRPQLELLTSRYQPYLAYLTVICQMKAQ